MSDSAQKNLPGYDHVARLLHWLVAGMIVLQYVLAELAEAAEEQHAQLAQLALLANHKSVGITILMFAVARVAWRLTHPAPPLPDSMPSWQHKASNISHSLLYVLLFALPISGWLMSSATAYSVSWFNLFTLPDLVSADESLEHLLHEVHEILAISLFVLALLHIAAALKHALIDKDNVLSRMSSSFALLAFVAVIAAGVIYLQPHSTEQDGGPVSEAARPHAPDTQTGSPADLHATTVHTTTDDGVHVDLWQVDYDASYIRFSAEQAGAAFTGTWTDWQADIRFDPQQLTHSQASVVIQTSQVDSQDAERDSTITGSDFFAAAQFPQAFFRTHSIAQRQPQADNTDEQMFLAQGELLVKDARIPAEFSFSLNYDGDNRDNRDDRSGVLLGTARLDRLQLGIGTGDWTDTSWVGQFVTVDVKVVFSQPASD